MKDKNEILETKEIDYQRIRKKKAKAERRRKMKVRKRRRRWQNL